jgi:AraC-like DNA-binding protein
VSRKITRVNGRDKTAPVVPPLATYQHVTSADIGVLHDAVEPLAVGHDLQAREPGVPLDGIVNGLELGSVSLVWVRYGGGGVIVDTPPTNGEFALCVPSALMGVEYRRSRRRELVTGNLVVSHDEPMRMMPDPARGCLVISTTAGRLSDHLCDYLGRPPARPLRFHSSGQAVIATPVIEHTWRHTCALLDHMAAEGIHPMAARSLEQSLLTAILLGLPHTASAELADYEPARSGVAGRIREWLVAHHHQPIGVADIAAAMDLSIRRLQAICRSRWDQTPMQLLRGIRLDHARAALLSAEPASGTVSRIASTAGFTRVSRFIAAYRERFGETPTQTLSRAAPALLEGVPASSTAHR